MWDLWWTKWHWDMFFPEFFVLPRQFDSTGAPLLGKVQNIIIIIFIIGSHNKPHGCGAPQQTLRGTTKKKVFATPNQRYI
jgi:hypothetical protein